MLALLGMGRGSNNKRDKDKEKETDCAATGAREGYLATTDGPTGRNLGTAGAVGATFEAQPQQHHQSPVGWGNGSTMGIFNNHSLQLRGDHGQPSPSPPPPPPPPQQQRPQIVGRRPQPRDILGLEDPSECDCCGRSHSDDDDDDDDDNDDDDDDEDDEDDEDDDDEDDELETVVDGDENNDNDSVVLDGSDAWSGGVQGTARSSAPAPLSAPAGSGGFSLGSFAAPPVHPLGAKVGGRTDASQAFSVEVGAVERGLHIQLGEKGAKTEAQLGEVQLEAAKRLRNLLSTNNRERMIQELLARGWVPLLLRWLSLVHRPNLQVEALWALTNVAQNTTEHTPLLLKHGAVGTLVGLLQSPIFEVVEQAMWVLGNMAQEGQEGTAARDAVLQAGVLGPLVRCMEQHPTLLSLQRIGAWSLCNLCDGQPRPAMDVPTVNTVMAAINRLLRSGDSEVLSHACSALSHLCDGSAAHIKVVVESGVCKRLVELLNHNSWRVVKPALRTIGNVVCAEDDADYTEAILEAGSVACLQKLIAHPNREIQKEACWTLSNIAAGSVSQIQAVLDSGAMPQLIKLATSAETDSEVRSEAFWVVLNATSCGSDAQIEYLVSQGCVQILSDLLGESSMVMMALEGIERVLSVGDLRAGAGAHDDEGSHCVECASVAAVGVAAAAAIGREGAAGLGPGGGDGNVVYSNPYACMLTPEKIQALEGHKNSAVAKRANRVWARYFVTCAICRRSFSRDGTSATFCTECKCHVCASCDCTVFHLAYQDKLWQEMEGKEKKGKQAQQAAKKSKKAKKKEKKKLASTRDTGAGNDSRSKEGGKARVVAANGSGNGAVDEQPTGGDKAGCREGAGEEELALTQRSRVRSEKADRTGSSSVEKEKGSHSSASTESNSEDEYSPSFPNKSSPGSSKRSSNKSDRSSATSAASSQVANGSSSCSSSTSTAAAIAAAVTAAVKAVAAPTAAPKNAISPSRPRKRGNKQAVAAVPATAASNTYETPAAGRPSHHNTEDRGQQQQYHRRGTGDESKHGKVDNHDNTSTARQPSGSKSPATVATPTTVTAAVKMSAGMKHLIANGRTGGSSSKDESEEPWVVVRGKAGASTGSSGTKLAKRKKGQREREASAVGGGGAAAAAAATAAATPPGGGVGSSVVEWASESGPAALGQISARSRPAVSPTLALAVNSKASGVVSSPRVMPSSAVQSSPAASTAAALVRSGNPWGIAPASVSKRSPGSPRSFGVSSSPALAVSNGNVRSVTRTAVNGQPARGLQPKGVKPATQRQGPGLGPGLVWGTTPPLPPPSRPLASPPALPKANERLIHPLSSTVSNQGMLTKSAPSGMGTAPSSRARGGSGGVTGRAGVIGPSQPFTAAPAKSSSPTRNSPPGVTAAFKPLGPSSLLQVPQSLPHRPLAAPINLVSAAGEGRGKANAAVPGGAGTGRRLDGASSVPTGDNNAIRVGTKSLEPSVAIRRAGLPTASSKQRQVRDSFEATKNGGPICAVSRSSSGGGGGDGEALVENEKLVSFLMETGSILALAQRLEEEEEWRRTTPSPASSRSR